MSRSDWDEDNFDAIKKYSEEEIKEIENKILKAIDAKRGTISQILRGAKFPEKIDLSIFIDNMVASETINYLDNGVVRAYFRYERMPLRFWVTPQGKVGAEYPKKRNVNQPRSFKALLEKEKNQQTSTDHLKPAEPKTESPRASAKPPHDRRKKMISLKQLENLAAEGLSKREIAVKLDISYITLMRNQNKPEVKAALERGRKTFSENNLSIATEK